MGQIHARGTDPPHQIDRCDMPDRDRHGAETWLYDMDRDPTERINLAAAMPAKVAGLKAALADREEGRLRVDVDGVSEDTAIPRDYIHWATDVDDDDRH